MSLICCVALMMNSSSKLYGVSWQWNLTSCLGEHGSLTNVWDQVWCWVVFATSRMFLLLLVLTMQSILYNGLYISRRYLFLFYPTGLCLALQKSSSSLATPMTWQVRGVCKSTYSSVTRPDYSMASLHSTRAVPGPVLRVCLMKVSDPYVRLCF